MEGADWLRTQLTSFGCAACGRAFRQSRIRILAQRDGLFFVDLGCETCGASDVAVVTIRVDGTDVTQDGFDDLSPATPDLDDVARAGASPVSDDDLIAAHRFLADFHGDVAALFAASAAEGE